MTQTNEQYHSASNGMPPWGPTHTDPAPKAIFAPKSGVRNGVASWLPVAIFPSEACQSWQMTQTNEQYHSASNGMPPWGPTHTDPAPEGYFCAKIRRAAMVRNGVARWLPVAIFPSEAEACQSWQMTQTNEQYH